jgi:hypothetical protein
MMNDQPLVDLTPQAFTPEKPKKAPNACDFSTTHEAFASPKGLSDWILLSLNRESESIPRSKLQG